MSEEKSGEYVECSACHGTGMDHESFSRGPCEDCRGEGKVQLNPD